MEIIGSKKRINEINIQHLSAWSFPVGEEKETSCTICSLLTSGFAASGGSLSGFLLGT